MRSPLFEVDVFFSWRAFSNHYAIIFAFMGTGIGLIRQLHTCLHTYNHTTQHRRHVEVYKKLGLPLSKANSKTTQTKKATVSSVSSVVYNSRAPHPHKKKKGNQPFSKEESQLHLPSNSNQHAIPSSSHPNQHAPTWSLGQKNHSPHPNSN
jgi:hypothetical protein